jgi:phenylpropionate dioxygenase-like ring-hydroxylating dioxygenase large terminal subunit
MASTPRVVPHSQSKVAPSFALPQAYFTTEEWHQRDLERVFRRRWLFVGHASQLARTGDFFTYEIANENILVARSTDSTIHAFYNTCRHRGSRICTEPSGNVKAFMCPYHNWVYGLDGRLVTARQMTELDKSHYSAVPVWSEVWNGMIFVNFSPDRPQPVAAYLSKVELSSFALDQTRVVHDRTYTVASNWKFAAETFAECYHCRHVHPELVALVDPLKDLEAWDDADAGNDYVIFSADLTSAIVKPGTRSFSMSGDVECQVPLGNGKDWRREIAALSWFPQFGIFVFPDHAVTYSWTPVSPTVCLFRSTWLVHENAVEGKDYDLPKLIKFADILNHQDARVCEVVQLGVKTSGYRPGPYHPVFEGPVRGFNRVYLQHVT